MPKEARSARSRTVAIIDIWGCNGFDGDDESQVASSAEHHFNRLKLKFKR